MYRLALFPLDVVLLPRQELPLHIFEPRYRRMVARCLEHDRRFGLIYHDPDRMGPFLTEEGRVGCVAEIRRSRPLSDGRSLILVRGEARFRIREGIESTEPFYEAVVEPYMDRPAASSEDLRRQRRKSLRLFGSALEALEEDPERPTLPEPDQEASFPLAATLRIDPAWKQAFLELRDEVRRLERLDSIFKAASRHSGEMRP